MPRTKLRLFFTFALCLSMVPLALPQDADAGGFLRRRRAPKTTGSVHIRSINHSWGFPGEVSYRAKLRSINGVAYRGRSKFLRLKPGTYTFVVSWTNYQIPEHGGGKSSAWRYRQRGVTTLTLKVQAGKRYEMTWPAWDEFGGPTGFKRL